MGFTSTFSKLDRVFAWSFWGFVLAVLFGALSIYTEFFKSSSPRLELELLSNSPVLDVRERLPELEVLYRSEDIANSGKTLSVLLVRAVNRGSADILSSYYDPKDPVSLVVHGGSLIRADLSDTSNEYLRRSAGISVSGASIAVSPVILERDEWLILKALVLHDIGSKPTLSAHGKVAGQRDIRVVPPVSIGEKEGFWKRVVSGTVWVQLARIPVYILGAGLAIFLIVAPLSAITDGLQRRTRRKLVERFKSLGKVSLDPSVDYIFALFMGSGAQSIQRMLNAAADPEKLQRRITAHQKRRTELRDGEEADRNPMLRAQSREFYGEMPIAHLGFQVDVEAMIHNRFVTEDNGCWSVDANHMKVLRSFVEFLEIAGATRA